MTPAERLSALGGRRIGPHLQVGHGLLKAAERAAEIGATAVQIFGDNPTAWRRRREPPVGVEAFRERLVEHGIQPLTVHGPYLVNLAGRDEAFWARSIETVAVDLAMAAHYGAVAVTIHIGSHRGMGAPEGIARLARGLRQVIERGQADQPRLLLENSAGGGDTVGATIEELAEIQEALLAAGVGPDQVGFCLDTAHLWAAGYDISDHEVLERLLARFDELLGPEQLRLIHLNDSRAALGSRSDRHEHVGAGTIGPEGMRAVLRQPRLASVPMVYETPGMDEGYDAVNMERIRLLIAGEELPGLPPEAFALRRSRPRMGPRRAAVVGAPEAT
jgi:deoxyribonuclease-4